MRRNILTIAIAAAWMCGTAALACGPEGSLSSNGSKFGAFPSSGVRSLNGYGGYGQQQVNPFGAFAAGQQAQMQQARQNFAAQAAAYRARMKPIRQAAAAQKRIDMLAKREQYRQILAAKLNAQKMQSQSQPVQQQPIELESPFREVTPASQQQEASQIDTNRFVFTSTNLSR
jgi:hypothetical protein